MRHVAAGEEGADTFIPFLIYVVLKANPENLVSNLQCVLFPFTFPPCSYG